MLLTIIPHCNKLKYFLHCTQFFHSCPRPSSWSSLFLLCYRPVHRNSYNIFFKPSCLVIFHPIPYILNSEIVFTLFHLNFLQIPPKKVFSYLIISHDTTPYVTPVWYILYNNIFICWGNSVDNHKVSIKHFKTVFLYFKNICHICMHTSYYNILFWYW